MSDRNLIITAMEIEGSNGNNAAIAYMEGSIYDITNLIVSACKHSKHLKVAIVAAAAVIVDKEGEK